MLALRRRSSLASGLVTGLVGWNGFVVLFALLLGHAGSPWRLFGLASVTAVLQVIILWPAFHQLLALDRRPVAVGAAWGAVSGAALFAPWLAGAPAVSGSVAAWVANAAYIGAAVGGFLAYFFKDDAALEARGESPTAGRDAHWLEPFAFGAGAFALVALPRAVDAAVYTLLVGAMVGVVSAGVSHFSPDAWKSSPPRFAGLCVLGAGLGVVGGFLLRHAVDAWLVRGACGGLLTLVVTLLRGRALAARAHA